MRDVPIVPVEPVSPSPSYGDDIRRVQNAAPTRRALLLGTAAGVAALAVATFAGTAAMTAFSQPAQAATAPLRVVALGDSLTAGYMLPAGAAFPDQLEKALKARGVNVEIANAGVSGDTASQGLDRLDWSVPEGTQAVIVELGANDALRGLDPAITRRALDTILTRLKARGIPVLLAGMYAPRNMGAEYVRAFDGIYPDLAAKHGVPLYPFFLDGIVGNPRLNLRDGIHPTTEGVKVIVDRILPTVESFLASVKAA